MNGMQCLSYLPYLTNRLFYFSAKMNNKLSRLCGCEIREIDLSTTCRLSITSICNYCENIVNIQTHASGICDVCDGL